MKPETEVGQVHERYARRATLGTDGRYSVLNPSVWQGMQERQRAIIKLLSTHTRAPVSQLKVLEIGCGSGGNLLELLRIGFVPENLVGNELLPERVTLAKNNLPKATEVYAGDATTLNFPAGSFDIVFQSTVFTSLLDNAFQEKLADRMWEWIKPGGAILWYDFIYNNPGNPDVRGVPVNRIRQLFPQGKLDVRRVTLAPPISRRVSIIHPTLYSLFNIVPLLRTHVLVWISKD